MQRLYLQFYLTILVVLAVFVGAAALLWRLAEDDARTPQYLDVAAELTGALLPEADTPVIEQQKALEGLHRKLRFDLALYRGDGGVIAMAGKPAPRFDASRARTGWRRGPGGPNFTLQLPDGRWLVARQVRERPNPIFWITSLLGEQADARTRQSLKQDVAELDQLIEEILLASRLDAQTVLDRREPVDLLALAAEEAAHYDLEATGTPVTVPGDRLLLRRLIRNLLENAKRYAGDGPISIAVTNEAGRAVLEVADHGPGVPASERERIFEPFYRLEQTRENGRGSGLGLALVRQIARRHGGEAVCLTAEGGGSRFRIDLPIAGR